MPKDKIISFIDFFYPPFSKFMPEQTFRYAVCGGFNTVLSTIIFNLADSFIFKKGFLQLGIFAIKSYNASLLISFFVSFFVGFLLLKYVVFVDSNLKGRIQLFRYFISYVINLILSYVLMHIFIEHVLINQKIAQLITTFIVIGISYISQKYFTFKINSR